MTTLALHRSMPALPVSDSTNTNLLKAAQTPNASTPVLLRAWEWLQAKFKARSVSKPLELAGSLPLGDKRTVFVIKVGDRRFLVGSTPTSIVMLAELGATEDFAEVMKAAQETAPLPIPLPAPSPRKRARKPLKEPMAVHNLAVPVAAKKVSAPRKRSKKAVTLVSEQPPVETTAM